MTMREILAAPPTTGALNGARQQRLTSLVWSIPYSSQKSLMVIFMLSQYALGVDYINHFLFSKSIKGRKAIADRKSELKNGELTLTGKEEPFQRFLIKALATGKNWQELIHEQRISKVFVHIESLWHHREYIVMYICDTYYPKEEGLYLAFRCIFRSSEAILSKVLQIRDSHYYKSKIDHWISKQVDEINKLDDRLLSMLIQAVKEEMTLTDTMKSLKEFLNFQWIDKFCELHWLNFLCFQLQSGKEKEIFKTCEHRRRISWKKFDRNDKARYNGEVVYRLQKKLENCLKNYVRFEDYFIDELEIVLLNSIREELPWEEVKEKINSLFSECKIEADVSKQNDFQSMDTENTKKKGRSQAQRRQQDPFDEKFQEQIKGRKRQMNHKSVSKCTDRASDNSQRLDLNNEQKQTVSLIHKTQRCYENIQAEHFKDVPHDTLSQFVSSNEKELETLAQQKLTYYQEFPHKIAEVQSSGTKKLLMSLLAFEIQSELSQKSTMQPGDSQELEKQLKIQYSEEKETCSELQDHNPKEVETSGKTNHSIEHQDGKKKKKR